MKIIKYNAILNPNISRPARLLWAVLWHREQEGKGDINIDELAEILGVTDQTAKSYLDELREMQALKFKRFIGVQYTTGCSVTHPPTPGNVIDLSEPSNPYLN